jgi:hypothetical protein
MHINIFGAATLAIAGTFASAAVLPAQELGWSGAAQGSANALFGAAHTRLVATTFELGRADSALQVRSALVLTYGDDRAISDGHRIVTARAPSLSLGLDYRPFFRYSPFWFGTVESSLQQRLARRYDLGIGEKVTFIRTTAEELSLSLAFLFEHTRAGAADSLVPVANDRQRWSLRFRLRRGLTRTLSASHVTFYQPTVDHPGSYTVDTVTELQDHLGSSISLTVTLRDRFDSDARLRGALSNHDGQMLFGLRTAF